MNGYVIAELMPFMTPNFVRAQHSTSTVTSVLSAASFPLSAVDAESLSKLCDDFRAEVFRKAGKKDPKI